jgi:hypothetical protein
MVAVFVMLAQIAHAEESSLSIDGLLSKIFLTLLGLNFLLVLPRLVKVSEMKLLLEIQFLELSYLSRRKLNIFLILKHRTGKIFTKTGKVNCSHSYLKNWV